MTRFRFVSLAFLMACAGWAGGCRDAFPHACTLAGGDVGRTHAKPAEGGYYMDWDPFAGSVEVKPVDVTNQVRTQRMLVATVLDKQGKPLPNRRVEWIIPDGGVGTFLEVDESGWRSSRGHKVTNCYAITHTNNFDHVLTRGNEDPADDIHLRRGQSWAVVTSAVEGDTHVVAYVPGIYDWSKHKAFAIVHWYDVKCDWPPAASNPIGTRHVLVTRVKKCSDGTPLVGYNVNYKIVSGPAATFEPGGQTASVTTDKDGLARVTLTQRAAAEGTNEIEIEVIRPENKACCRPAARVATGHARKTWVAPRIGISKSAPATAVINDTFSYAIKVSNTAPVAAKEVVVSDALPDGIVYVSSTPTAQVKGQALAWSLGELAGEDSRDISVMVKGTRTGRFTNPVEVTAAHGLSARDSAETRIVAPQLAMEKQATTEVLICDPIAYTITVRNPGDAPAMNVAVEDKLPDGLETEDGRKTVSFRLASLAPGASKQFQFNVKAARTGTYVNEAQVKADRGLTANASARTVVRQPVLVMTKTGPNKRFIGRPVEYEITVANKGDGSAENTILTDKVPVGTSFVEASDGGKFADGVVTWNLGEIRPGQSRKVSLTLKAIRIGTARNAASAKARCAQASAEVATELAGVPAILLELIDQADPIEVGARETYVISVTNQGSAEGTNIVVTCTLPAEEEFISAEGPTKETVRERTVTFAPLESLAPKRQAVYRVVVKGTKVGDVRFKVSLKSDQMISPAEETESTHIYSD